MKKSLSINALLNSIRQGLSVLFPLITYPYVLRVLGVINIGKANYSSSIVNYFVLFAMLGISTYAIREGSQKKDDQNNIECFVSEIFTINVLSSIVSFILLIITLHTVGKLHEYSILILIYSSNIFLKTFSVDWINNVYEDFLSITIRSIIVYIITIICLFVFVKKPEDVYVYAIISTMGNAFVCIWNQFYCRKYVKIKLTRHINFKKHIVPIGILFANALAISIYVNVDITMLGWIKGDYAVGIYSPAVKIYTIVKNLLASIYVVTLPRLSNFAGNQDWNEYKRVNTELWGAFILLLLPSSFGLLCLSPEITYILGGAQLHESTLVLRILSFSLIAAIFGGIVTACMNISLKREKDTLVATLISAGLNLILNLFFIPALSQNGAAITTLISELFVLLFCFLRLKDKERYFEYKYLLKKLGVSIVGVIIIAAIYYIVKITINNSIAIVFIVPILSAIVYAIVLTVKKDDLFISLVINRVHKLK